MKVAVYALLLMTACLSQVISDPGPTGGKPVYGDKFVTFCNSICQSFRYDYLEARFPGIFFNETRYAEIHKLPYKGKLACHAGKRALTSLGSDFGHNCDCKFGKNDGDKCCGTCRYFEEAPQWVKIGEDGEEDCWVFRLAAPKRCQYIPIGTCSEHKGQCPGSCVDEYGYSELLCWNPLLGFQFVHVERPAYCACKS